MRLAMAVILMFASSLLADDTPAKQSPITFPDQQPAVVKIPVSTPVRLDSSQLYTFSAKIKCRVFDSPEGLVKITAETGPTIKAMARFAPGDGGYELKTFADPYVWLVQAKATGVVELLIVPDNPAEWKVERRTIDVSASPPPVPPVPPGPTPIPPGPVPIPDAGLRVLIVYESADLTRLPKEQSSILTSQTIRQWLNAHCVLGPDGKTKEYRLWDQNVDPSGESKVWQDAMKRDRKSLPWLIVSNGQKGFEGPLPGTIEETLKVLRSIGGE